MQPAKAFLLFGFCKLLLLPASAVLAWSEEEKKKSDLEEVKGHWLESVRALA